MKVLLVPNEERRAAVVEQLSRHDIAAVDYFHEWRGQGNSHDEKRRHIAELIAEVDGVVLDLTIEDMHSPAAMVLGMAVILAKPAIMIAENAAEQVASVRHILRYATEDPESMALFGDELASELRNPSSAAQEPGRPEVFLSYAHADSDYLDRLMVHLRPLERDAAIVSWSDARIQPGKMWREEIEQALSRASIAILLISADFLASDFIASNELPPLLRKAQSKGTRILPLILNNCRFLRDPELSGFQAVNNPGQPLASLEPHMREKYYDAVAAEVERLASNDSIA